MHIQKIRVDNYERDYIMSIFDRDRDEDMILTLTEYISDNYIEYNYLKYDDYLKCMYYAFLPIIKLNRIGIYFLSDEIIETENVIEILREENKSKQEPLPILLLRAVVLEYSLMLIRKMTQI